MWKFAEHHQNHFIPANLLVECQDIPEDCQHFQFYLTYGSHLSADTTQRSRLFICVETNSPWRLASSIAFAVSWVNSGQFLSGLCISVKEHYFDLKCKCLCSSPSSRTWARGGCWVLKTIARYILWKVTSAFSLALVHLSWKLSK